MIEQIQGQCTFETVQAIDLIDAANTLKGRDRAGIYVPHPGDGVEKLLNWAIADVRMSDQAGNLDDRERFAANAILHARRALACLVDWYMQRDCFALCKDAPARAQKKSEILVSRGIVDELTSHVLERAVARRNRIEHKFMAPALEIAEDVVELLRRTIKGLVAESDPASGPCLFGFLANGTTSGKRGTRAAFYGWSEAKDPAFILYTFAERPWFGVIIPISKDTAEVRRAFFNETDVSTFMRLLSLLERTFGRVSGGMDNSLWRLLAKEVGLGD